MLAFRPDKSLLARRWCSIIGKTCWITLRIPEWSGHQCKKLTRKIIWRSSDSDLLRRVSDSRGTLLQEALEFRNADFKGCVLPVPMCRAAVTTSELGDGPGALCTPQLPQVHFSVLGRRVAGACFTLTKHKHTVTGVQPNVNNSPLFPSCDAVNTNVHCFQNTTTVKYINMHIIYNTKTNLCTKGV